MSDFLETVPEEYQKPNISLAAKIVGKNRSVLYRDYIKNGDLSVLSDDEGKKFVPLAELQRVFGIEICAKNIKQICNTGNNDSELLKKRFATSSETGETHLETLDLRIQNTRLATENEYLKKMLEDQKQQTQAAELREKRIFEELNRSQMLLEDHRRKEQQLIPKTTSNPSLFGRLKAIFIGESVG